MSQVITELTITIELKIHIESSFIQREIIKTKIKLIQMMIHQIVF